MTTTIYHGDCLDILPTLPAGSVQCVVTSPPYWGLDSRAESSIMVDAKATYAGRFLFPDSAVGYVRTSEFCAQKAPYYARTRPAVALATNGSIVGRFLRSQEQEMDQPDPTRDDLGRFVRGHRAAPTTEFKKGQHWRSRKPYWNRDWLYHQYVELQRSAADIAAEFGCNENNILYFLKKQGIEARSMSEVRQIKHWALKGGQNEMYGKRGAVNPNWKGGCTPERQAFYSSEEWSQAAYFVWKRDLAKCVRCGIGYRERKLHIHHIVSFCVRELRAEPTNLVLLCTKCHRFVHSKKNVNSEYIKKGGGKK